MSVIIIDMQLRRLERYPIYLLYKIYKMLILLFNKISCIVYTLYM